MRNGIKIALVLLYAMQLSLMFRETLVHAYKFAVERAEAEKERVTRTLDGIQVKLIRSINPTLDPPVTISAPVTSGLAYLMFGFDDHGSGDADEGDRRDDQKEDGAKRGRRRTPGEWLVANLFPKQLGSTMPKSDDEPRGTGIVRLLTFASCANS